MKIALAAVAAATLAWTGTAQADTIIDTGPGSTTIFDARSITSTRAIAGFFELNNATTVNGVFGWIGGNEGARLTANIYSEIDFVPATLLHSTSFVNTGTIGWQGSDSLNWKLDPGTYWVVFSAADENKSFMPNGAADPLVAYLRGNSDNGWLRLSDTDALGVRLTGVTGGAVPEPASWAMMIGGFGLAGGAIRTRRKRPAALA
ncbi:PEPxxWA-CTERM sorting domain-containing protein [uncultured Sphingomonas sp.]|uniref:PEPxxWA-CTERM sorting domain-containing protein n=1 Tax=uncultured Sphingomonas sp. TaxID=158754 RepID=UPI0025E3EC32|nr:PEPxxWA-CTERM sorting domain-containing protein [uncultured Sphingomonas sp.]